jgi:uncharacterized protein YegP (UPF0339 family)
MIHILKNKQGKFYFVGIAKNGKANTDGQGYTRKESCYKGILSAAETFGSKKIEVIDHTWPKPVSFSLKKVLNKHRREKVTIVNRIPTFVKKQLSRIAKLKLSEK